MGLYRDGCDTELSQETISFFSPHKMIGGKINTVGNLSGISPEFVRIVSGFLNINRGDNVRILSGFCPDS